MRVLIVLLMVSMYPALAAEVAGVRLADQVEVGDQVLVLNGAGLRKKYFVKVYVAGLYLPEKNRSAEKIINSSGPCQVSMHFLRDVGADKITEGWTEGFTKNSEPGDMQGLQNRLNEFSAMFEDMEEGDEIILRYIPELGTQVTTRGVQKGIIPGEDFQRALLSVWFGEQPADADLRKAMLGIN